jgi:membrane fusion protein, multidrug efflux system
MVPFEMGMVTFMKRIFFALTLLATASQAEPLQGTIIPFKQVSLNGPVVQEIIKDVLVEEGTYVRKDQILVELRKEREELDVKISEKLIDLKSFIAKGQKRLFKEKMGSEEKALEAQTDLELSKLQMEAKKVALSEKTVRSPIDGVVVKKYKEAGETVDRGEKLLDIVNLDTVYAQFYLKPDMRNKIKQDAPVKVSIDLGSATVDGKITFIDSRNDAASGLVRIKVLIDNKDGRLTAGMKCSVDLEK